MKKMRKAVPRVERQISHYTSGCTRLRRGKSPLVREPPFSRWFPPFLLQDPFARRDMRWIPREITLLNNSVLLVNKVTLRIFLALTDCNLDYRVSGTQNDADYVPPIEINDNQPANFKTTDSPLDSTDTVTVNTIPFTYNGAYKTGSLTVRGLGNGTYSQSFELIHTFRVAPISIYSDGDRQPDDFNLPVGVFTNLFTNDNQGRYGIKGTFSNQVNGSLQINFDTGVISFNIFRQCKPTIGMLNKGGISIDIRNVVFDSHFNDPGI